jgi:hypothetical protein
MNRFKLLFILFPLYLVSLRLYSNEIENDSKPEKKISIGFSFSPRYCWGNVKLNERASIYNKYIYPIVLYNFNSKLIFSKLFGNELNLRTGVSLINYGVKTGHISLRVGQDPFTYEIIYDSIDVKSTSTCISIPIGMNRCIKNKNNILEIEAGVINNFQVDVSYKPINGYYGSHPPINPWFLGTRTYYLSIYFQINYVISIEKLKLELSPVFNYTPYDISVRENKEFIKFYQVGLDIGLRF